MKKALAVVLVVSFMLLTGTAFAADIPNPLDLKFDGSLTLQWRNDSVEKTANAGSYNGLKTLGVLNIGRNIGEGFDFYARATYENLGGSLNANNYTSPRDFVAKKYDGTIDAFGVKAKLEDWTWTLGSQALTIGQGMIYDNGFIGSHALPYALDAKGKMGAVNTEITFAKTNYQSAVTAGGLSVTNDKFTVVQLGYDVSPKTNIGAFYTKWTAGGPATYITNYNTAVGIQSMNFYGMNVTYKAADKVTFNGEFAKSNANKDNKAYIGGITYAFDNVDKVSASAYRSEDLSGISDYNFGNMTTAPNANTNGYIFSWKHVMSDSLTLKVGYDSYTHINATSAVGTANDRSRTTLGVTYVF